MHKLNIGNNSMRSLMVPYGLTLEMYDSYSLTGTPVTVVGQDFIDDK